MNAVIDSFTRATWHNGRMVYQRKVGFLEEGKKEEEGKKGTRLRMLNDRFLL